MRHIENDSKNGVDIYQLTDGTCPADTIYGEQPYTPLQGGRIAVCCYPGGATKGGLAILEIESGSLVSVTDELPTIPAFHAWGDYLYYQVKKGGARILKRCHYQTLRQEEILALPKADGALSYGTVSPDERFYAVTLHRSEETSRLLCLDFFNGEERILAESPDQYFKHEQFSLDGRNRILIQANSADVKVVNLGIVDVNGTSIDWLPVDAPPLTPIGHWPGGERYTPRCTGHEAWIGQTEQVFLSTRYDEQRGASIWRAATTDPAPTAVCQKGHKFGHVSVSRCGRFWIADAPSEAGVPIYMGSLRGSPCERVVYSHTRHDGKQWSHTHPYLTADNQWLIFTSNRSGQPQVCGARIQEGFLSQWA